MMRKRNCYLQSRQLLLCGVGPPHKHKKTKKGDWFACLCNCFGCRPSSSSTCWEVVSEILISSFYAHQWSNALQRPRSIHCCIHRQLKKRLLVRFRYFAWLSCATFSFDFQVNNLLVKNDGTSNRLVFEPLHNSRALYCCSVNVSDVHGKDNGTFDLVATCTINKFLLGWVGWTSQSALNLCLGTVTMNSFCTSFTE